MSNTIQLYSAVISLPAKSLGGYWVTHYHLAALAAKDAEIASLRSELAEARRERDEFRSALLAIFAVAVEYDTPEWNVVSDCARLATGAATARGET